MYKLKYKIIIFLYMIFIFVSCSPNKLSQDQKQPDDKVNNAPQSQNINTESQSDKNNNSAPEPQKEQKAEKKSTKATEIGSYKTTLTDKDKNRVRNIVLASKKINGYVVKPGDVFSFNNVVGERTSSKGYKKAKIIVNGESSEDLGGGICQLSSTIYNAAEASGLEIIERHSHSKEVVYVPLGKDAAVDYGNLDFKFKNNKNHPVKVKIRIKNSKVYVSILKI